jgi:SSS family transporter
MDIVYIVAYLLLQIGLAVYLNRHINNNKDFFLAGRNLPTFAIAFSIFATWFGAETCIGSSGAVFSEGLSGSKAEPLGYGLCLIIFTLLIIPKFYKKTYTTTGDFFKERFSLSSEKILVMIMIPSGLIWGAAQVRAFGQVISLYGDFDINAAISFATLFVIAYTFLGGMLGDIITDVIQGGILALTLLAVLFFAVGDLGGFGQAFASIDSSNLSFMTPDESIWERLDSWMIPILGSLTAQELVQRALSAKNKGQAVSSGIGGFWLYLVFGSIPVFLGLIGPQLGLGTLADSEQFLPALAQKTLPKAIYIIFIGALISAILSTIDSILLAASALITTNLIVPSFKISDEGAKLKTARFVLVACGLVAYIMALYGESVYDMVELASSFGTAGILVAFIGGLYSKSATHITANVVMIMGLILSVSFHTFIELEANFTLSVVLLSVFYIIGGFVEAKFGDKLNLSSEKTADA